MDSDKDTRQSFPWAGWVAPFGDPGINDRSHLPRAFRSVPRPSSPLSAKASTRCPSFRLIREAVLPAGSPTGKTHPGTPPRTGASASREARARQEANSPGKPAPRQQPRRGLSHEDTSFGPAPWACGPCPARKPHRTIGPSPGLVRLGHIHKSISPFNQHRRRGLAPAASPRFSERRSQRSRSDRTDRAPVGATAHLQPRPWVPRGAAPAAPIGRQSCALPVVEVNGIEPMTSCLQSRRSPN